jgi:cell division protein FtsQ
MDTDTLKTYGRLALRLVALATVVGGVLVLGMLGWQWQATAPVERVAVTGTRHAPPDTLRHLARVDTGMVMSEVDARMVRDRVTRHPWVEDVEVRKQSASRTLTLAVTERTPAGLVVSDDGRPAFYVDAAGYAMPLPDSAGYDVPLVQGLRAMGVGYNPVKPVLPPPVRAMLTALQTSEAAALVGAVRVHADSSLHLTTTPIGAYGALPVRVGTGNFPQKLTRLQAFARQVLAAKPSAATASASEASSTQSPANKASTDESGAAVIRQIDLRFDGQIVTREHPLDG